VEERGRWGGGGGTGVETQEGGRPHAHHTELLGGEWGGSGEGGGGGAKNGGET